MHLFPGILAPDAACPVAVRRLRSLPGGIFRKPLGSGPMPLMDIMFLDTCNESAHHVYVA